MPRAMNVIFPMEIIIQPNITYVMIEYLSMLRRIYTDGRNWPKDAEPSFMGYSIGKWIDEDGRGRYNVLEVETRNLKGRALSTPAASLCTRTIKPSSRSGSTSTDLIPTFSMTKLQRSTMR